MFRASAAIMTSSRASSEVLLCTKWCVLGTFLPPLADWWRCWDGTSSWLESVSVLSVSDSFPEPSVSDALSVFSLSIPSLRGEALFLLFFGFTSTVMAGTGFRALLLIFSALCRKETYTSNLGVECEDNEWHKGLVTADIDAVFYAHTSRAPPPHTHTHTHT